MTGQLDETHRSLQNINAEQSDRLSAHRDVLKQDNRIEQADEGIEDELSVQEEGPCSPVVLSS